MDAATTPVILSAARTPVGKLGGALAPLSAGELGAAVVRAAVERAHLPHLEEIDEVMIGNVIAAGAGQNVARQAAIWGGLPASVGASSLNKVCGSGLKAVMLAAQAIKAGDGALFVVGGVESMSNAPHLVRGRRGQLRLGHLALEDAILTDGLGCPFEHWLMGDAAEFIADAFEVTREEMDRYALGSHQKAIAAMDSGQFADEIVPITVKQHKGETVTVTQDEGPRRDTSLEKLAALPPAFKKQGGKVTAGNSPGLSDGAAALVVASQAKAQQIGARPLARIVGYAQVAQAPKLIFDAPARAILRLLERVGWRLDQVDLIEINEAFAAQVLANGCALAEHGWDWAKVNVNGGAVALGHPLGATGARILVTLLHALRQRGLQRGIATLCLGGGEAVAVAVEQL